MRRRQDSSDAVRARAAEARRSKCAPPTTTRMAAPTSPVVTAPASPINTAPTPLITRWGRAPHVLPRLRGLQRRDPGSDRVQDRDGPADRRPARPARARTTRCRDGREGRRRRRRRGGGGDRSPASATGRHATAGRVHVPTWVALLRAGLVRLRTATLLVLGCHQPPDTGGSTATSSSLDTGRRGVDLAHRSTRRGRRQHGGEGFAVAGRPPSREPRRRWRPVRSTRGLCPRPPGQRRRGAAPAITGRSRAVARDLGPPVLDDHRAGRRRLERVGVAALDRTGVVERRPRRRCREDVAREPHGEALQPRRVAVGDGLHDRLAAHRHRAEAVGDDAGQADLLGERLVEMDRHLVARRVAVAERLVVVDVDVRRTPARLRASILGEVVRGLSGPPDSPSLMPRTKTVTYCVSTGAPSSSTCRA